MPKMNPAEIRDALIEEEDLQDESEVELDEPWDDMEDDEDLDENYDDFDVMETPREDSKIEDDLDEDDDWDEWEDDLEIENGDFYWEDEDE